MSARVLFTWVCMRLLNRLLVIDLKTVWELPVSLKSSFLLRSLSLCLPVGTRACLCVRACERFWARARRRLYSNITQTHKCCSCQQRWERTVHKDVNYRTLSHCPSADPLLSLRYPWDIISVITAMRKNECTYVCVCVNSLMEVVRFCMLKLTLKDWI